MALSSLQDFVPTWQTDCQFCSNLSPRRANTASLLLARVPGTPIQALVSGAWMMRLFWMHPDCTQILLNPTATPIPLKDSTSTLLSLPKIWWPWCGKVVLAVLGWVLLYLPVDTVTDYGQLASEKLESYLTRFPNAIPGAGKASLNVLVI